MTMELTAGVGRSDITPAPGTPQGGWGAQTHARGDRADMPFYATALALAQGGERVVIVEADAIGFDAVWTGKIARAIAKTTGLAEERIRFSCSHTHSGPNTFRLANISEGLDMALSYLESLPDRIAGAAWQALQDMKPVRVGAGAGQCGINCRRRVTAEDGLTVVGEDADSECDHSLHVVRLEALDGEPVAHLLHYACHGTTIAWQSQSFTPDFPGPARQVMERALGGLCLFLQGAAGDLGPRRGFTGDLEVYRRMGRTLGLTAAGVASAIEMQPTRRRLTGIVRSGANIAQYAYEPVEHAAPVLQMETHVMALPLKAFPDPDSEDAELARLRAEAARLRESGRMEEFSVANGLATQMGWRANNARLFHGKTETPWPLQVIRVGPVALVSVAGEPFSSIGQRVADASPFPFTLMSGYSNGGFGYIPDRSAYDEGGYEIEATPFSADASDVVVAEALRVLNELHEKEHA
ncbi:neutral/alkaline non-lysosomal ceramidase N-terminal domain-containing protein [uncultured Paludibaculum sp.]|uniref:neutral/alkaline non-lysosomal ceramidase N-terminal domain-containing protein n=1 Tax=uncultured Paludibaculum sp. TaxID=1765020 RepID=UPI002AAA9B16|nr:neutral/alkaline non-lysosomal ceramidase N-terminal domain-containing protein [uncultured Paludibaculum sp.]